MTFSAPIQSLVQQLGIIAKEREIERYRRDWAVAVKLEQVSFTYGEKSEDTAVLRDMNMHVPRGEFVSLLGKSGTGKSTVFKLIAGLIQPSNGQVLVEGEPCEAGRVGYMPQKDLLLPWRTVLGNAMLACELSGGDRKLAKSRALEWMARIGLEGCADAYPHELSGGMRQRAAFLRTMMTDKDVLLLDEPFGALDALTKREMHLWLLSFWEQMQRTVLFITHDLEEAVLLSDRVFVLQANGAGQPQQLRIDLPRPRKPELVHTIQMLDYRKRLERMIYAQHD
ncbi:ABC transporter ATP-binding protein [Marinicrinis lubricantis]|uniref:ABC transporter ATP-binding protein n=1 Tax=Marinicrinis lubricantis TaxID=2086470 RepID=A0ABW1IPT4_9BACL